MGETFITRRGGGGGTGGTLVVTGAAGSIVNASKDGKTYTKILNSNGQATFKGLATGTWTITMTNGTSTATRTIAITADYDLTIAYFSATISITYPAASTCIVTDSNGVTVASDTNGGSTAKTFTATVNATGEYTIAATSADGDKTKNESVSITEDGQSESVTLSYRFYLFNDGIVNDIAWDKAEKDKWNYGQLTIGETIELYASSYWDANYFVTVGVGTAIDLSDFSTLQAHLVTDEGEGNATIFVGTSALASNTVSKSIPTGSAGGTISVDISALTDNYFISLNTTGVKKDNTLTQRRTGYDAIWLE